MKRRGGGIINEVVAKLTMKRSPRSHFEFARDFPRCYSRNHPPLLADDFVYMGGCSYFADFDAPSGIKIGWVSCRQARVHGHCPELPPKENEAPLRRHEVLPYEAFCCAKHEVCLSEYSEFVIAASRCDSKMKKPPVPFNWRFRF